MNLPPRDYTEQENFIAESLNDFGMRYQEQADFFPYTVDFFIPEVGMIIEADGYYGHLAKRDAKRDEYLGNHKDVDIIIHLKEKTQKDIKERLWQELNKLSHPSRR
jgi:very-short-patch-repair endonuclease